MFYCGICRQGVTSVADIDKGGQNPYFSTNLQYYHYSFCPRGGQSPLPTSMGGSLAPWIRLWRQVASSLETQILKIGRIFSVRWVASSMHTVNSVVANYAALCEHFNRASNDPVRDGKEKKQIQQSKKNDHKHGICQKFKRNVRCSR